MLSAFHRLVLTDPAADFLAAQTQNVMSDTVSLALPAKDPYWFIRGIQITAVQGLSWEVWFFSSADNFQGTMASAAFLAAYNFAAPTANGQGYPVQPVAGGSPDDDLFRYSVSNLLIPYIDQDFPTGTDGATARLHLRLINRSATAKIVNAGGAVQVGLFVSSQGAQA